MLSSVLTCHGMIEGQSYGDITSIRLTPVPPGGHYRCPVSTPANYPSCSHDLERSKTLPNISLQQHNTDVGRTQKRLTCQRSARCKSSTSSAKIGSSLEFCFLDMSPEPHVKESEQSNWLKSLCAQPVEEILNKYQRNCDFRRTRNIWSQTSSTPGEKSLLYAWQSNKAQGQGNGKHTDSAKAYVSGGDSNLGMVVNQNNLQINVEHKVMGVSGNVHGCGDNLISPYLKNNPRFNGFLKNDSRLSRRFVYMARSSHRQAFAVGHSQLPFTQMGIRNYVHAKNNNEN